MNEVCAGFMQFFRECLAQEAAQDKAIGKFSWDVSRGHKINMRHSAPRGLLVRVTRQIASRGFIDRFDQESTCRRSTELNFLTRGCRLAEGPTSVTDATASPV